MPHRYLLELGDAQPQGQDSQRRLPVWLRAATDDVVREPRLCHALRRAGAFGEPDDAADTEPSKVNARKRVRSPSLDIPWVTLVLGSECLDMQPPAFDADAVLESFRLQLITRVLGPDDGIVAVTTSEEADAAGAFVKALVRERLGLATTATRAPQAQPSGAAGDDIEELGSSPVAGPELQEWKLRLVEATAIVNSLYFQAKREQRRAVSRWNEGSIPLLGDRGPLTADAGPRSAGRTLEAEVERLKLRLASLEIVLESVHDASAPIDLGHLYTLVNRVRTSLADPGAPVFVSDVQAMTEVAWATLVQNTEVYPPWPELLVDLCLQQGSRGIRNGTPRPSFIRPTAAEAVLRRLLLPVSAATEKAYLAGSVHNERDDAYREYARILVEQARWRRRKEDRAREIIDTLHDRAATVDLTRAPTPEQAVEHLTPLVPTAFVTTFDVELEMALRFYHPDQPFVVAVPVHLLDRFDKHTTDPRERATSMWLAYVVRPSERGLLEAVTRPADSDWFVLSSSQLTDVKGQQEGLHVDVLPEDVRSLADLPFVVRLSGSPLVDLPDLGEPDRWNEATDRLRRRAVALASGSVGKDGAHGQKRSSARASAQLDRRPVRFVHAPLLEEHHSLRLSLPEIEMKEGSARGLPRELTNLQHDGFRRYWLLLGVQLSDSVVRLRLMAQFISAGLMHSDGTYRRPLRYGMAMNRTRLSARATDLLQWSEFDIVGGDLEDMTAQLSHYSDHLKTPTGLTSWPVPHKECEIR